MNHERTISTIAASPDFETLKAELNRVVCEMESDGIEIEVLGPEIVKLGAAIALPVSGPVDLMVGLHGLLNQMAADFPQHWEIAKAKITSRGEG